LLLEGYDSSDGVITQYTSPSFKSCPFFLGLFPNTLLQGLVTPTKTPRRQQEQQQRARTHLTKMNLTSPTWKDLYDGAFLTTRIFIHGFLMMTITDSY